MKFADIKDKIVNRMGFESLEQIRRAGYRVVRERDGDRYFLAREEELRPLLVKLGDIADVRFGIKTGANEFFYLAPVEKNVAEAVAEAQQNPETPIRVRNSAGWEGEIEAEFLKPVIKSPREVRTLLVREKDLKYLLLMCPYSKEELRRKGKTKVLEYIKWGELQGFHKRQTCKGRQRWWDLGNRSPADVNCNYLIDDRMRFYYGKVFVSDNFQEIRGGGKLLGAALQVPFLQIFCELGGRAPFGGGLLKVQTYEVEELLVLNPSYLCCSQRERLLSAFEQLCQREIKSIFEELGLPKPNKGYSNIHPEDVALEKVLSDRYELDSVIFDALGLTHEERLAVYRAVVQMVKDRLVKAKSV
ncbi:MAG: hypothetical protein HPY54_07270 [Chthonomonadetes bacterium]|nr:hypothetical protein [Chthonomonadetes bacterium]